MRFGITEDIIKGIYLLILLIIGGETISTFSSQATKLLRRNIIVKYIIIYSIIYFSIDYSSLDITHPKDTFISSIIIFILYLIISRQNLYFTIALFVQITIMYILYDFSKYYKDRYKKINDQESKRYIHEIDKYIDYLSYIGLATVCLGFIQYYIYQRKKRGKDFKTLKFIFGPKI